MLCNQIQDANMIYRYGNDERLTENYDAELWANGYWVCAVTHTRISTRVFYWNRYTSCFSLRAMLITIKLFHNYHLEHLSFLFSMVTNRQWSIKKALYQEILFNYMVHVKFQIRESVRQTVCMITIISQRRPVVISRWQRDECPWFTMQGTRAFLFAVLLITLISRIPNSKS